jgi:hypothetical protein
MGEIETILTPEGAEYLAELKKKAGNSRLFNAARSMGD